MRRRGARVRILPHTISTAVALARDIDGLILSPGPGDPARLDGPVDLARAIIDDGRPLLGICLGHQIVGRAAGAETRRLRFGHHGANHPVRDVDLGLVQVTAQNHEVQVVGESLPPESGLPGQPGQPERRFGRGSAPRDEADRDRPVPPRGRAGPARCARGVRPVRGGRGGTARVRISVPALAAGNLAKFAPGRPLAEFRGPAAWPIRTARISRWRLTEQPRERRSAGACELRPNSSAGRKIWPGGEGRRGVARAADGHGAVTPRTQARLGPDPGLGAGRHRPGGRVRLRGDAGLPRAPGRGCPDDPRQQQPGDDHDRPPGRRRDLPRAAHPRGRRGGDRQGAAGGASRRTRRPDGAQPRDGARRARHARALRREAPRHAAAGDRDGGGSRALPRPARSDRSAVRAVGDRRRGDSRRSAPRRPTRRWPTSACRRSSARHSRSAGPAAASSRPRRPTASGSGPACVRARSAR